MELKVLKNDLLLENGLDLDSNNNNEEKTYRGTKYYNYTFPKGNNNLKEIFNQWDRFINWSLNSGHSHFSVTINLPEKINHWGDSKKDYINILKMHPIEVPRDGDKHINDESVSFFKYCSLEDELYFCGSFIYDCIHLFMSYPQTTSWLFLTNEENKNGVLHFHGILAVKNFMDYNKHIKDNIADEFKTNFVYVDIVLKNLDTKKDIKGWVRYMHVGKSWVFKPHLYVMPGLGEFVSDLFDKVYWKNYDLHNLSQQELKKLNNYVYCNSFTNWFTNIYITSSFYTYTSTNYPFDISGRVIVNNSLSGLLILDLIVYYLILNKYYLYNGSVYKKVGGFEISYELVGSIKNFLFDEFEKNVVGYFFLNYPCHIVGLNIWHLVEVYKTDYEQKILKIGLLSKNVLNPDFTVMEFTDGVYDIKNNKFYPDKNKFNKKRITFKYYNQSYNWIRQNKPETWINGLKHALDNDEEAFMLICFFFAQLFQQDKDEGIKKKYLYVHGKSNTGKTTYLTKVLIRYFGMENVGSIISASNFKFQDIYKKLLVIMDEFKYSPQHAGDFLKLLGGEPLLTSQKYDKEHIIISNLMGLVLSNIVLYDKNKDIMEALLNRLHLVEFKNIVLTSTLIEIENVNEILKKEEPNIVVFCNKLYFSAAAKKIIPRKKSKERISLNHKNSADFGLFKFVYEKTIKYKIEENFINGKSTKQQFFDKFTKHPNLKFKEINTNQNIDSYATCTTTKSNFTEEILPINSKNHYVNLDNLCFVKDNIGNIFKKCNDKKQNSRVMEIHNSFTNSNKVEKIENKISTIYNNFVDNNYPLFELCMKKTHNIEKCYKTLYVYYGPSTEILVKVFIYENPMLIL